MIPEQLPICVDTCEEIQRLLERHREYLFQWEIRSRPKPLSLSAYCTGASASP